MEAEERFALIDAYNELKAALVAYSGSPPGDENRDDLKSKLEEAVSKLALGDDEVGPHLIEIRCLLHIEEPDRYALIGIAWMLLQVFQTGQEGEA